MVGCAFVEFKKMESATEAIKNVNGSKFLNRPIAVDWAVPKEVFASQNDIVKDEPEETAENEAGEEMESIKKESEDEDDGEEEESEEDEEMDEDEEDEEDQEMDEESDHEVKKRFCPSS